MAFLRHLDHQVADLGLTRERAINRLLGDAEAGRLPEALQLLLPMANARSGQSGDRTLSRRTLQRWAAEAKQGMDRLAPKAWERPEPLWAPTLLDLFRKPQKPSLRHIVLDVLPGALKAGVKPPSYDAARRWLEKVGEIEKMRGRMLDRELKTQKPFIRRTFADLEPLDVVTADGHTFDAEVQHPHTGRPFRPEITTLVDIATRRVIGWSVGLAESALVVIDAFRHAVITHGIPAIFYTDNGPGYVNAQVVSMLTRVGTRPENSIPYNSQARGVIERLQKTLWVELCAKQLPTYMGKDMDRQAKQIVYKHTRKVDKSPVLVPWETFLAFVDAVVGTYNSRPHSALPRLKDESTGGLRRPSPEECWQRFCAQGWSPCTSPDVLDDLMPQEIRTAIRGEISLFGHTYFSAQLAEWNGEKLRVAYDVHDASRVWVRTLSGTFICEARFEANSRRYFPTSVVEDARHTRLQGQLKRLDAKAAALQPPDALPALEIRQLTSDVMEASDAQLRKLGLPMESQASDEGPVQESSNTSDRPAFRSDREYYLWVLDNPDLADPEEVAEVQTRLKRDPFFSTLLGRDSAATA